MINSILANSTSGGNCSVSGVGGEITDGGHNIDDGGTCGFRGANCVTTGTSFCKTDPLLDPAGLASNGGPTQTIALQGTSPAVNAGDETVCAAPSVNNLDQRGFVRPGAGATNCSIGAFEFNAARCGDVNGDGVVNIGDALLVAQFDVGLRQCGVAPFSHAEVCDVNRDGACNIGDALRMAQCDVRLIGCAFTCVPFACPSTTTTTTPIPPCSNIGGSCGSCVGGGVCVQLCGHSCTRGCLAIQGNTGGTCTSDGQCPPGKLCATNPNECPADCGPTLAAVCAFPCP